MNDVRGIADECDALGDEGARDEKAKRMNAPCADALISPRCSLKRCSSSA